MLAGQKKFFFCFYTALSISFYFLVSFQFNLKDSLQHFLNFLIFCLPGNMLISPSFLKEFWLAGFFSFSHLWTYQPTVFWPSQVSHEKSANDIVWDPLSVMSHFSHWFQGSLSFSSLIIMCHSVGLLVYSAWSSFMFLDVYIHILPQIRDVFLHWISLVIFFHFSNCTFQLPNFLKKYLLSKKTKQNNLLYLYFSILLKQL